MGTHTSLDAVYRDINKQFDKVEKRSDEEVDKECLVLAENTLKEVKEDHFDLIALVTVGTAKSCMWSPPPYIELGTAEEQPQFACIRIEPAQSAKSMT